MYKKILIPLDGSELSELVIPYTIELAGRLNSEITFLIVCDKDDKQPISASREYIMRIAGNVREQVNKKQDSAGTGEKTDTITVNGELRTGYPAEEILEYVEENAVDLIVMTTHGYSGIKRWALGSTADKVLRKSAVPVLLVRAGTASAIDFEKRKNDKIIVFLDGSGFAESVLDYVEAVCGDAAESTDIVLLRVAEIPDVPDYFPPNIPVTPEEFMREAEKHLKLFAQKYLSSVEKRLKERGFQTSTVVLTGNPADEVLKYTMDQPGSLIAMSTHGRSGITRWVYGSVAERVVSEASNPILLVRPVSP